MKMTSGRLVLVLITALCVAGLAMVSDEYREVNSMTGESRYRVCHAFVFSRPWTYQTTKVSESARRQGISTESGWKPLSHQSNRLLYTSLGCSRSPVANRLGSLGPDDMPGGSTEAFDRFVAEFAAADEKTRVGMVNAVGDGDYKLGKPRKELR